MEPVSVIVLAAGRSSRFADGAVSKLLASLDGEPIVRLAVRAAVDAAVGDVIVVTGDRSDQVVRALEGITVRIVHEPGFAEGMATSLRRGIEASAHASAVLVGLGDQPRVRPEAYQRVVARWRKSRAAIVVPRYAESRVASHPVLFDASVFGDLRALRGDIGARSVIERHAAHVVDEALEWTAPMDVDTLDDLDIIASQSTR